MDSFSIACCCYHYCMLDFVPASLSAAHLLAPPANASPKMSLSLKEILQ